MSSDNRDGDRVGSEQFVDEDERHDSTGNAPQSDAPAKEQPKRLWWGGEVNPLEVNAARLEAEKEKETWWHLLRPSLAEFLAMFIFCYIACGAAASTVNYSAGPSQIAISLAFGFAIVTLAFTFGHISGAHVNFAVTFSLFVQRKVSTKRMFCYFIAQFLASVIAGGIMKASFPTEWERSCYGANKLQSGVNPGPAFFVEMILTGYLLVVVNAASDSTKANQTLVPLAIGLAVFGCHMVAVPLTGTSINPTRSFASAVASSSVAGCDVWKDHWIFWVAPILGGTAGGLIYEYCFNTDSGASNSLEAQYQKKKPKKSVISRFADTFTGVFGRHGHSHEAESTPARTNSKKKSAQTPGSDLEPR